VYKGAVVVNSSYATEIFQM